MKITQKSHGDYIRKKIIAGHIDVDVEVSVEDYMKSLEDGSFPPNDRLHLT